MIPQLQNSWHPDEVLLQAISMGDRVTIPTAFVLGTKKLPYIPLYVSDLLGSEAVREMTEIQFSRYVRLLISAWDSDEPGFLSNNPERLWVKSGAVSRKDFEAKSASILRKFVTTEDGKYIYNRRLLQEFVKKSTERAAKSKGGKKRHEKQDSSSLPEAVLKDSSVSASAASNSTSTSISNSGFRSLTVAELPSARWKETLENGLDLGEAALVVAKLHPHCSSPYKTAQECALACEKYADEQSISLSEAMDFVKERTEQFRDSRKAREPRTRYTKNSPNWFKDGCFAEDPKDWNLGTSEIDGLAVHHMDDGRKLPGYTPRSRVAQ